MNTALILGGGGHARVVCEAFSGRILGFVAPSRPLSPDPTRIPWLGDDEVLKDFDPSAIWLLNGVGSTGDPSLRVTVFERGKAAGFAFAELIHTAATVAGSVRIEEGAQIMAGAVVQSYARIGRNTIINSGAIVDHDVVVGDHVHVAPGAVLSGGVVLGSQCHVGVGASIIQGVRIGAKAIVGAGAVVVSDVREGVTVVGVPAIEILR